jgi:dUTPase
MKNIQIKYVNESFKDQLKPAYVTPNQFQLVNFNVGKISIRPGQSDVIDTGISIYIPSKDLCGLVTMHPALATEGGVVYGGSTILPSQYEKPLAIRIENRHPTQMLEIDPFAPIALVTLMPTERGRFVVAEEFKPAKDKDE